MIEVSPINKKYRKSNTLTLSRFDQSMGAPIVLGIVFFFILCLGAADVIRSTAMIAAIFMMLVAAVRFKVLRERIHLPFLALTLYVIMDGISTFYAVSGKFALREFLKVFLAYLLSVILLAASPKKEETTGKRIATILAVCTAIGSLVSIDLISTRWISGAVTGVLGLFTESYESLDSGSITRISSIFSNSNVFGGVSGIGLIIALGLADVSESRKERSFYLALNFINAMAFMLAYNRGAYVFIAVALIVFALIKSKSQRTTFIGLLFESLAVVAIFMLAIIKLTSVTLSGIQLFPLLCTLLGAAVLCVLDYCISRFVAPKLQINGKTAVIILACVLPLLVAYAITAVFVTSDVYISPGEEFNRIAFLEPGDYILDVHTDGEPLNVRVFTQSKEDVFLERYPDCYNGNAYGASFTIPEETIVVLFRFSSAEGVHFVSASYDGHDIPLRYMLLPSFFVNRIHTLSLVKNFLQRIVYFQDGLKLFRRSPIIGLGMGAFENAIKSVQSFYYETKYAHNNYFQTMLETGIIGLLLFLFLLVSAAAAIWKSRKKQPYAPMLAALWMFMAGQALHDIVFSAYAYLPLAYGSFALIDLCCGKEIAKPKLTKTVKTIKTIAIGIVSACTIVYCVFIAGNLIAKRRVENSPTLQTLAQCVELDRFEWADYALPYVINATGENVDVYVLPQADIFAERLSHVNSNTIPIYLAEYYFKTERPEKGIEMLEKYVAYIASDVRGWESSFSVLSKYDDGSELYRNCIIRLKEMMDTWNAENIGTIQVSDEANAYIAARTAEA